MLEACCSQLPEKFQSCTSFSPIFSNLSDRLLNFANMFPLAANIFDTDGESCEGYSLSRKYFEFTFYSCVIHSVYLQCPPPGKINFLQVKGRISSWICVLSMGCVQNRAVSLSLKKSLSTLLISGIWTKSPTNFTTEQLPPLIAVLFFWDSQFQNIMSWRGPSWLRSFYGVSLGEEGLVFINIASWTMLRAESLPFVEAHQHLMRPCSWPVSLSWQRKHCLKFAVFFLVAVHGRVGFVHFGALLFVHA